ncbi:MAG: carbon-nitrogen hydrolase family protein [Candidatus Thermoplasmatota archaeon]|nr:carbon-nitrogen hydrolase family protein [Candidatus Thermoplasmatota archaeon]
MTRITVAAVQARPVALDAQACLAKAARLVAEAGDQGAEFVVFPETFVPGYCQWAHSAPFEHPDHKAAYARLVNNSLLLPDELGPIQEAARAAEVTVALGVTERVEATPGTLYNTLAIVGPGGGYIGKHRKLVPTHHERTVYEHGPGETLRAFETTIRAGRKVRFGGLLCWNNYMPLARYALYQQGIQLYLAPTADDLESWQTAMRFIARESRCYVIAPALLQHKEDFPEDWELADEAAWQAEPAWNERGGSCIVSPDGEYVAKPVYESEAILTAEIDLDRVIAERQTFDPAGHYGRRDVLSLEVEGMDPLR